MAYSYESSWPYYRIGDNALSMHRAYSVGYGMMPDFHLHDDYEIFYLRKGERVFFIKDHVYTARQGDIVMIRPNILHRTGSGPKIQEYERVLIRFKSEFAESQDWLSTEETIPSAQGHCVIHLPKEEQTQIDQIICEMFNECREQRFGYEDYLKSCLTLLLLRIRRQALQNGEEASRRYAHPMQEKMEEIAFYIARNYSEELTLKLIAEKFYISPYYLSRIFKKLTGFPFQEYILSVRIKEAQKLLRESHYPIIEIAHQVGFKYVPHFNATFKKIVGIPPLAYRKQDYTKLKK